MADSCPYRLIRSDDRDSIQFALDQLGLWSTGEKIEMAEPAGQGNMNLVLRVVTDQRTVILKQSRPWVEKYPDIAAPSERIVAEFEFYDRVSPYREVCGRMPGLLAYNAKLHLLAIEDLGRASDYTDLYRTRDFDQMPIAAATAWLARLHAIPLEPGQRDRVGNRTLRQLNHAHIYVIPMQTPSVVPLDEICPGLEQYARKLREDPAVAQAARQLGDLYLDTGGHLLHGDYYPGSWLCTDQGLRVIDPEFTFAGPAEFDLGVLAAHRVMAGGDTDSIAVIADAYASQGGSGIDHTLTRQIAGMEIIRRLIGVAQLPIRATARQRVSMLEIARDWLL